MSSWPYGTAKTIAILAPLSFAFAFALDIYIPAVPGLPRHFNTTTLMVQLTLSGFFVINGIGQLVVGPISDQIGRRKVAIASVCLYILGSVLCSMAPTIGSLIAARLVQACGSCGCMVVAYAIIRDIYQGKQSARMYSYLNGSIAFSPMVAPVIGSYLDLHFNWRACFLFLALLGTVALYAVCKPLKETLPKEQRVPVDIAVFKRYLTILRDRQFLAYGIMAASGVTCFFTYFSCSSYIYMHILNISEIHYAYYFAITAGVSILGSILGASWCVRLGVLTTTTIGALITLAGGLCMVGAYLLYGSTVSGFLFPMFLVANGATMVIGAAAGGAFAPFKHIAGTAAATLSVLQFVMAAIIATLLLHKHMHSTLPIALLLTAMALVMLCSCAYVKIIRREDA